MELLDPVRQIKGMIAHEESAIVSHLGLSSAVQQQLADTRSRTDASIEPGSCATHKAGSHPRAK